MDRLTLALLTFDVGVPAASPDAFADRVCAQVREAWDDGADLVVLPEFLWMGLEPFVAGEDKLRGVAQLFWTDLWPRLAPRLATDGVEFHAKWREQLRETAASSGISTSRQITTTQRTPRKDQRPTPSPPTKADSHGVRCSLS